MLESEYIVVILQSEKIIIGKFNNGFKFVDGHFAY